MKKKIITLISVFFLFNLSVGQTSVTEFTEAQKTILSTYLQKNPKYEFVSEGYFNENGNERISKDFFGKSFKPYYSFSDFNNDGKKDFAVLLSSGRNNQVIVIFNNINNTSYQFAFKKEIENNQSSFIYKSEKYSANNLYYGVLETDIMHCFRPAGKSYIMEYCGQ